MQLNILRNFAFFTIFLSCISCATSNPLVAYINNEKRDSTSVFLEMTKLSQKDIAKIYKGVGSVNWSNRAKSYTEFNYQSLLKLSQDDDGAFWSERYAKNAGFKKIVQKSKMHNRDNKVIFSVSDPIYLNNNNQSVYRIFIAAGIDKIMFDGIIIMENRNGKWELLEKVYSTDLY